MEWFSALLSVSIIILRGSQRRIEGLLGTIGDVARDIIDEDLKGELKVIQPSFSHSSRHDVARISKEN